MSDLISRQDAIDAFWKLDVELRPSAMDAVVDMFKSVPSAEPERKKGKWIKAMEGNAYRDKCNQCGRLYPNAYGYNLCPNCGADMREDT